MEIIGCLLAVALVAGIGLAKELAIRMSNRRFLRDIEESRRLFKCRPGI